MTKLFLISKLRRVLYVVYFLLGNSPASEFYMPTFRNTLFHLHSRPMNMERIECSETSAYKIQTPRNYPEENIQQMTKLTVALRNLANEPRNYPADNSETSSYPSTKLPLSQRRKLWTS